MTPNSPPVSGGPRSPEDDARARTDLVAGMYAEDYPSEVAASSSCDWPLLGLMTTRLRMHPDQLLVDAGCGTGLWLARTLMAHLEGVDLESTATAKVTARRARCLAPDSGWAVGGAVSLDVLFTAAEAEDRCPGHFGLGTTPAPQQITDAHQALKTLPHQRFAAGTRAATDILNATDPLVRG
ncbi:hypothetical protein ACFU99_11100 [Streptomyces sp. NPDC057654]|uniref:hypothetical protein n=1 Tax=Streptomyces sp. NPDC057654 TaxID=3346196 RepID=UPI0036C18EEC